MSHPENHEISPNLLGTNSRTFLHSPRGLVVLNHQISQLLSSLGMSGTSTVVLAKLPFHAKKLGQTLQLEWSAENFNPTAEYPELCRLFRAAGHQDAQNPDCGDASCDSIMHLRAWMCKMHSLSESDGVGATTKSCSHECRSCLQPLTHSFVDCVGNHSLTSKFLQAGQTLEHCTDPIHNYDVLWTTLHTYYPAHCWSVRKVDWVLEYIRHYPGPEASVYFVSASSTIPRTFYRLAFSPNDMLANNPRQYTYAIYQHVLLQQSDVIFIYDMEVPSVVRSLRLDLTM
eukprot:m.557103 g.557103  ORF g.557103 m.557103 type:complete len:286 (+) comp22189_c1_seq2:218-1075(+)